MNIARDDTADAIKKLTARWSAPGGLPFKGKLIGEDGCMCAQGQALHYVGGYTASQLSQLTPLKADKETARILGISTTHSRLLRQVNTIEGAPSIVLTHPDEAAHGIKENT